MAYLLDANVFIQAKNLHYGFDFCPAFWDWIDAGNGTGTVFSIDKVRDELIGGGNDLAAWAKARDDAFFLKPDGAVVASLQQLSQWASSATYTPAAVATFLQVADYYLVAHAHAHGLVVVSHEIPAASPNRIKIPDACIGMDVKFMTPFEMLRTERARFVLENAPATR